MIFDSDGDINSITTSQNNLAAASLPQSHQANENITTMPPKNVRKLHSGLVRFMDTIPEEKELSGEEMAWLRWQRKLRELVAAVRQARQQQ